jgi:aryl-alcohol dehydrogenase-like predicted oxidoreductase
MSHFALGTAQFGLDYGISNKAGQVSRQEAKVMLQLALANNFDTLDTAIAYGDSEMCLGEVGTKGFKVVTKLPSIPDNCKDVTNWVKQELGASLSRLGVNSVYGLLLHRSEQLQGPNGARLYQALQALKDSGQVKKVGVSIYSPSELETLMPIYRFDLIQAPFNLVDQRLHTKGWLQRLKDEGIEIHSRSVFFQGLLLMEIEDKTPKILKWICLLQRWHKWLVENNITAVQACLAFPLSFPEIDRVVVGADSVKQLTQIVNATNNQVKTDLPDFQCEDESLINPARWLIL